MSANVRPWFWPLVILFVLVGGFFATSGPKTILGGDSFLSRDSMETAEEDDTVSCNVTLRGQNYTYSSPDIASFLNNTEDYAFLLENESFAASIVQLAHMVCYPFLHNYKLIPENMSSSDNTSSTWLRPPPIGHEVIYFTFFNETDYVVLFVHIFYNENTHVRRLVNQRLITLAELNASSHLAILESVLEDAPQHSIYPAGWTWTYNIREFPTTHVGAPGIPFIIGGCNITRWLNITGWEIPAEWFHLSEFYSSIYLEYTSPKYDDSLLEEPTWNVIVRNSTHYPGDPFSPRTYTFIYTLNGTLLAISTPVITAPTTFTSTTDSSHGQTSSTSVPAGSQVPLEFLVVGVPTVITIAIVATVLHIKRRKGS